MYPDDLINNLKFCFKEDAQKDENHDMNISSFFHFMIEDEPVEIDFLKWLEDENMGKAVVEKVDLMPLEVFEEYVQQFCKDTGRSVVAKQKLIKRFKKSEPGSILNKLSQLLPYDSAYRKKNFRYVSQRYLADSDTYKCLVLPIKSDYPMFRKLVTEHWKDLNDLSADYLDIYYCFENYGASGYDLMRQLHYLPDKVHAKLPCIIIWKENMDQGLCTSIDGLSAEDVYYLIREIVDLRLVFVLDDFLAPRADREAVSVFIDPDGVYSHGQTVCRGEQQVKDGVGKRRLFRDVLPDVPVVIGMLMKDAFENRVHL